MASPSQVTIGTKHTQNTTDKPSKNNVDKEECGEIVDYEGDYDKEKGGEIVDNIYLTAPAQVTLALSIHRILQIHL